MSITDTAKQSVTALIEALGSSRITPEEARAVRALLKIATAALDEACAVAIEGMNHNG